MDLFTQIDDAKAIVRIKGLILKQVDVYHRRGRVYVPHSGGFVRVTAKFGDTYGTAHPSIKVDEIEGAGIDLTTTEPRYLTPLELVA
jgi:hypothetical protein